MVMACCKKKTIGAGTHFRHSARNKNANSGWMTLRPCLRSKYTQLEFARPSLRNLSEIVYVSHKATSIADQSDSEESEESEETFRRPCNR